MSKSRERSFSGFLQSLGPPACSPDLEKEWAKRLGGGKGTIVTVHGAATQKWTVKSFVQPESLTEIHGVPLNAQHG